MRLLLYFVCLRLNRIETNPEVSLLASGVDCQFMISVQYVCFGGWNLVLEIACHAISNISAFLLYLNFLWYIIEFFKVLSHPT